MRFARFGIDLFKKALCFIRREIAPCYVVYEWIDRTICNDKTPQFITQLAFVAHINFSSSIENHFSIYAPTSGWHVAHDGRADGKSPAVRSGPSLFYPREIRPSACSKSAFTFQNGHNTTWHLTLRITRIPTKTVRNNNLLDCVSIAPVIGFDLPGVFHRVIISVKCLKRILVVSQFGSIHHP